MDSGKVALIDVREPYELKSAILYYSYSYEQYSYSLDSLDKERVMQLYAIREFVHNLL